MATLSELTLAHSQRLSAIARQRDEFLSAATADRDRQLRAIPAAAKAYRGFDDQVAAVAARLTAEQAHSEAARSAALDAAHLARRDADLAAVEKRRATEAAAEQAFTLALAAAPAKNASEAQRARREAMDRARHEFDAALAASQDRFRDAVDRALASGRPESSAAMADAERELMSALEAIPAAASVIASWRQKSSGITGAYRRAQDAELERFHREMEALRSSANLRSR